MPLDIVPAAENSPYQAVIPRVFPCRIFYCVMPVTGLGNFVNTHAGNDPWHVTFERASP